MDDLDASKKAILPKKRYVHILGINHHSNWAKLQLILNSNSERSNQKQA